MKTTCESCFSQVIFHISTAQKASHVQHHVDKSSCGPAMMHRIRKDLIANSFSSYLLKPKIQNPYQKTHSTGEGLTESC